LQIELIKILFANMAAYSVFDCGRIVLYLDHYQAKIMIDPTRALQDSLSVVAIYDKQAWVVIVPFEVVKLGNGHHLK
jgi:hypothetical protein